MNTKNQKRHVLESIVQDAVVTLLIAGCAVSSVIGKVESKNQIRNFEPVKTVEIRSGYPISGRDSLIFNNSKTDSTYVESDQEEATVEIISESDIDIYLDNIYKRVKVPSILDRNFVKSIIEIESGRNRYAISEQNAKGLMQLTGLAWREIEPDYRFEEYWSDPERNIEAGIKYLSGLNIYCRGKYPNWTELPIEEKKKIIAAAYNFGAAGLEREEWDIANTCRETRNYVDKVELAMATNTSTNDLEDKKF